MALMDRMQTLDDPVQSSNAAPTFKNWLRSFIKKSKRRIPVEDILDRSKYHFHICNAHNCLHQVAVVPPLNIAGVFRYGQTQDTSPSHAAIEDVGDAHQQSTQPIPEEDASPPSGITAPPPIHASL